MSIYFAFWQSSFSLWQNFCNKYIFSVSVLYFAGKCKKFVQLSELWSISRSAALPHPLKSDALFLACRHSSLHRVRSPLVLKCLLHLTNFEVGVFEHCWSCDFTMFICYWVLQFQREEQIWKQSNVYPKNFRVKLEVRGTAVETRSVLFCRISAKALPL